MFQLVVVQNGQYGFVHKDNEKMILDHPYKTYQGAAIAARRRYRMLEANPGPTDVLEGSWEDFTITVKNTDKADFTDHYFIEEV